jgi:hypothetical protein
MFLGYACATMILLLAQQQSRWFLAAMVMFALPVLDTALALARRWVNKRPLFSADRHHFHHQMVARGLTVRKTVLLSYVLAMGFALLGALIVVIRTRYAVAIYLVTFGSIIVAAFKMGMVHEKRAAERVAGGGLSRKNSRRRGIGHCGRGALSDDLVDVRIYPAKALKYGCNNYRLWIRRSGYRNLSGEHRPHGARRGEGRASSRP